MKRKLIVLSNSSDDFTQLCKDDTTYQIVGATDSGTEGLKLIAKHKPDAIILDLVLKDLDGLTLLEKIESLNLSTKTLVYSAFDSDDIIRCASQKGASLYLVKPLSPQIVLERLNGLFQKENSQLGKTAVNASSANDKHTHLSPQETVQSATDNATELRISNVFLSAGIPPHIKGYAFMRMGVKLVIKNSNLLSNITKELYPQIAIAFNTSPSKVERAIRHAIEVAWNRGRIENLNSIFGVTFYQSGDKPTNGEFIALVADRIIQEIHMGKLG